jgi:hypothetical protein
MSLARRESGPSPFTTMISTSGLAGRVGRRRASDSVSLRIGMTIETNGALTIQTMYGVGRQGIGPKPRVRARSPIRIIVVEAARRLENGMRFVGRRVASPFHLAVCIGARRGANVGSRSAYAGGQCPGSRAPLMHPGRQTGSVPSRSKVSQTFECKRLIGRGRRDSYSRPPA